jgi:hypothetical protein
MVVNINVLGIQDNQITGCNNTNRGVKMTQETKGMKEELAKLNSGGFVGIGRKEALEELGTAEAEVINKALTKLSSGGFIGIGRKEALEELGTAEEMKK